MIFYIVFRQNGLLILNHSNTNELNASNIVFQDVNECAIGTHDCSEGQRCDNSIGSFICSRTAGCGTGYTLNYQKGVCEDDDECELHTDNCNDLGPEFVCRNTLGSYRCERIRPQTLKPTTSQQPDVTNLYNFINGQLKRCLPGYRRNAQGDCEGMCYQYRSGKIVSPDDENRIIFKMIY